MNRPVIYLMAALSLNSCTRDNTGLEKEVKRDIQGKNLSFFYEPPREENPILYATYFEKGACVIDQVSIKTGMSRLFCKEIAGKYTTASSHATFDNGSGFLFIADHSTLQLWMNMYPVEYPSFYCGTLEGRVKCACFLNGDYYYVDDWTCTLNMVRFTSEWMIAGENILDTMPAGFKPDGMIISPALDYIYFSGINKKNGYDLISWSLCDSSFHSTSIKLKIREKIAFGSDNILYAISPSPPYRLTPLAP
jgi:hypothetical protein